MSGLVWYRLTPPDGKGFEIAAYGDHIAIHADEAPLESALDILRGRKADILAILNTLSGGADAP